MVSRYDYPSPIVMTVLREMTREFEELKREIASLREDLKTYGADAGGLNFWFEGAEEESESDEESSESEASVQSAPATVSYEREERQDV